MTAISVDEVGPSAAARLAALHARAFGSEAWSADLFERLLATPACSARVAAIGSEDVGLVLDQAAAGEAEILTIGVDPPSRRGGVGRALMVAALAAARARGDDAMFLDVSETNAAARALYGSLGFVEAGRRPRYYSDGADALVLRVNFNR